MRSALFAATRYLGLAALIANASLYFSNYSPALCSAVHIIPGIFQVLTGLVVQIVFFLRTLDITKRERTVFAVMIFAMIISVPLEAISVGLNREAVVFHNDMTRRDACLSKIRDGSFNSAPVFYLAHLMFDLFAIFLSTFHLVRHGVRAQLLQNIVANGVFLMMLDAVVNTFTLLGSIGVSGIEDMGSIGSTVTGILVAQHILFLITPTNSDAPAEFKHEVVPLPPTVYKASDAHVLHSTGTLPRFATPTSKGTGTPYGNRTGLHRSMPSADGSASMLHSCVGREALKFRVDGDVHMFQSKTSLSVPDETRAPIPLDVKRLSQQNRHPSPRPSTRQSDDNDLSS